MDRAPAKEGWRRGLREVPTHAIVALQQQAISVGRQGMQIAEERPAPSFEPPTTAQKSMQRFARDPLTKTGNADTLKQACAISK